MRHRKKTVKLSRTRDIRVHLFRNLVTSLFLYDRIETTKAKAKAIKPIVDNLITIARTKSDQIAIRSLNSYLFDQAASKRVMEILKPKYKDRTSGFTRIRQLGPRNTDRAPQVQIELV